MKAIKRNLENLEKVAESIVNVPFSSGVFEIDWYLAASNIIQLVSIGRTSIGVSILSKIPSNYFYRLSFKDSNVYLTIWFR